MRQEVLTGYKLFSLKKGGSLGPLFINKRLRLEPGQWYSAESHPTKGYAFRPGWHILAAPNAPHLSKKGRVWAKVEFNQATQHQRPVSQGGLWYLAKEMRVVQILFNLKPRPKNCKCSFEFEDCFEPCWCCGAPPGEICHIMHYVEVL